MDARSALLDVYGDHLRTWPGLDRGATPVAALVELLAALDVREPAVRTAVSRMLHAGWLEAVRLPAGACYALSPRAARRLDEAAKRIYRTGGDAWDGQWHVLVVAGPAGRAERNRLHAQLAYLGYGPLGTGTWVAPRPAPELDGVLSDAGVQGQRFRARYEEDHARLARRVWDLPALAARYEAFLDDARERLAAADPRSDAAAFAARLRLLHAWRQFLKVDPGLPAALLPADWPGTTAAAWFDEQSARLLPAARAFVEQCLAGAVDPAPAPPSSEGLPCPRRSDPAPSSSTSSTASPP